MTDEKKTSAKEKTIAVRVMRDFWIGEGDNVERIRKGTIVDVSIETALDGVESGALSRVK